VPQLTRSAARQRLHEAPQRWSREPGGLARGEGSEHERADDEGEHGSAVLLGQRALRAPADRLDLGVEQSAKYRWLLR
jgi:hypothetical protein